jgi:hypothetical protein
MIRLLALALEIGALAWIIQGLLRRFKKRVPARTQISFEEALPLVKKYGLNSNSFLTLYPGFEYFRSENPTLDGMIAYVNTTNAWVAAAEPIAAHEDQVRLLTEFADAATQAGKRVLLIPADQDFAERAAKAGFGALLVGSEPTILLDRYPKTGSTWLDVIPSARQFSTKGAVVKEFNSADLSDELRAELDQMTLDWLGTRKTATLGFLNQVHPWLHAREKKFFTVELDGKIQAFLAAIPIPARNSWYLIDTIRRSDSSSGTTELLLLQAMKFLQSQGAKEITMGVAPLSAIETADKIDIANARGHPILYRIMRLVYERGNQFYNFKPLFTYKMKFHPTVVRPVFLLYKGSPKSVGLSASDIVSISQAWLPHGISHAAGLGMIRLISRLSFPDMIKGLLRPGTIVRSVPPSFLRLVIRCRLTLILIFVTTLLYFLTTDSQGMLQSGIREQWSFSWSGLSRDPIHTFFLAPLLQPNLSHFVMGLFGLVVFTGGMEYLAGSTLTAFCFFLPMLLSSPLAALMLDKNLSYLGGSLGVLGTAGGLYWFFKKGRIWLPLLGLLSTWGNWSQLNHWIAILLGVGIMKIVLRS